MFESKFNVILGDEEKVLTLFGFHELIRERPANDMVAFLVRDGDNAKRTIHLTDIIGVDGNIILMCTPIDLILKSNIELINAGDAAAIIHGELDGSRDQSVIVIDSQLARLHSVLGANDENLAHTSIFLIDEGDEMPDDLIPE